MEGGVSTSGLPGCCRWRAGAGAGVGGQATGASPTSKAFSLSSANLHQIIAINIIMRVAYDFSIKHMQHATPQMLLARQPPLPLLPMLLLLLPRGWLTLTRQIKSHSQGLCECATAAAGRGKQGASAEWEGKAGQLGQS